jgi:hypothetical protein
MASRAEAKMRFQSQKDGETSKPTPETGALLRHEDASTERGGYSNYAFE